MNTSALFSKSALEALCAVWTKAANAAAPGGEKLTIALGDEEEMRRAAPPRVTLIVGQGRGRIGPVARRRPGIRAAHEVGLYLEASCWGRDFEQAYELLRRFDKALFDGDETDDGNGGLGGAYQWLGDLQQLPGFEGATARGFLLVAPLLLLRCPLVLEAIASVDANDVTATASSTFTTPDGSVESPGPTITTPID